MKPTQNRPYHNRFWCDVRGFIALYLLSFFALGAIFYFLDGFSTGSGVIYFLVLNIVFLAVYLIYYWFKKKKQYALQDEKEKEAARDKEKALAVEKRYQEQILFINRWVHYIKTPLSVITSITEEYSKETSSAQASESLIQIQAESDRILSGVNSALNFTRATDFATDFKIEKFDLYGMFVELINELKMNFIRNHVYPDLKILQGAQIRSDRKWLKFLFFQILTNAIKYSNPEGKVSIYLKPDPSQPSASRQMMSICVSDTGIGILKEDLPRIFDIFYTGTNGRIKGESTGIGLYMVKTICTRLGYTVTAESVPSEGTTIAVNGLPVSSDCIQ